MKIKMQFMAVAAATAFTNLASAAYVVDYDMSTFRRNAPSLAPYDWVDHITPSHIQASGNLTRALASSFSFKGFGQTLNPDDYVGFSVKVDEGYQLNLTDITFSSFSDAPYDGALTNGVESFQWAFRIDSESDGVFEQDWAYGTEYKIGDPGFVNSPTKQWDFTDFSTTGTIEFGLFATAADGTKSIQALGGGTNLSLNGTVTVVPEPSSMLLGAIGGLVLFRRRRQSN